MPPAMPPLAEPRQQGRAGFEDLMGFELGEDPRSVALSDASAASADLGPSQAPVTAKTRVAPELASPQPKPPFCPPAVDVRRSDVELRQAEDALEAGAAHPAEHSERSNLKSDTDVNAEAAAPSREMFSASQSIRFDTTSKSSPSTDRSVETDGRSATPSSSQVRRGIEPAYLKFPTPSEIIAAVPSSSGFHSVNRKAHQSFTQNESQAEQVTKNISGALESTSRKMSSAKFPVAEADASSAGKSPSRAIFRAVALPSVPLISRAKEPDTQISIGRVEVQVNNQPSVSPTPAMPATKANGNRQDTLQRRFLDRFMLRP